MLATVSVAAVWLARSHAESIKEFIDHNTVVGVPVYIVLNILDAVIAYDFIMFGIGGVVVGWIVYSTRRGARTPAVAKRSR